MKTGKSATGKKKEKTIGHKKTHMVNSHKVAGFDRGGVEFVRCEVNSVYSEESTHN